MDERGFLIKLFDLNKVNIGKGELLSINNNTIIVKGNYLPVLSSGINIYVNIYNERVGVSPYFCKVSVASKHQLTAQILKKDLIVERRRALKVRTDLFFYINRIHRNNEDITDDVPIIKINVLNLSIGGMLVLSNYDFLTNDEITFYFKYYKYKPILLEAKIIRIDKLKDEEDETRISLNYGCHFLNISSNDESIMFRYLFDRQIQIYRNKW